MKCEKCGYDDHGTGDFSHVCSIPAASYTTPGADAAPSIKTWRERIVGDVYISGDPNQNVYPTGAIANLVAMTTEIADLRAALSIPAVVKGCLTTDAVAESAVDFPGHPEPHSYQWTKLERATIEKFGAQQRQEGRLSQMARIRHLEHERDLARASLPATPASPPSVAIHFVKSLIHPNGWHECSATEYAGHVMNGFVTRTLYTAPALSAAPEPAADCGPNPVAWTKADESRLDDALNEFFDAPKSEPAQQGAQERDWAKGYLSGQLISDSMGHKVRLHFDTQANAEEAFDAFINMSEALASPALQEGATVPSEVSR